MADLSRTEHIATFEELKAALPPEDHHEYNHKRSWMSHMLTNNMAVFPDFATQMGRAVHIIDIRPANELAKNGIIPGSNWYPRDAEGFLEKIQLDFPSTTLIAIVDFNGVFSRHIASVLRAQYGFKFAAVLAGGVRLFRVFGFSVNRSIGDLKKHQCEPISLHSLESFRDFNSEDQTTGGAANVRDMGLYHSERRTLEQVARHVEGDLLQWIKMGALTVHGRLSCIDGRGGNGCVGTPGGDMGEMVLILSTYEHLIGYDLTLPQVRYLFHHRLDTFGRFYLHTDETNAKNAMDYIKNQIIKDQEVVDEIEAELLEHQTLPENWLREFIHLTPIACRDAIMNYLINPECVGCGHLKLMMTKGEQYKVRPTLIKHLLRAFYESCFWDETSDCDYVVLAGSHAECGVLSIEMNNEIKPYTKVPLIAPSIPIKDGHKQMFVSHPTIMTFLRKQQCEWLLEAIEAANEHALQELQQLALLQQQTTITSLASPMTLSTNDFRRAADIVTFVTLSKNARKAFNPLVDLSADQHGAISLGYLAAALPIYRLVFDAEHSRCKVDFIGFVEALNPATTSGSTLPQIEGPTVTAKDPETIKGNASGTLGAIDADSTAIASSSTPLTLSPLSIPAVSAVGTENTKVDGLGLSVPTIAVSEIIPQPQSPGNMPATNPTLNVNPALSSFSSSIPLETPSHTHQFAKMQSSVVEDAICHADHHGMVIRSPFPLVANATAAPMSSPHPRQRASLIPSPALLLPSSSFNMGSGEANGFTVTADLHLPSEVHHYHDDDASDKEEEEDKQ